MTRPVNVSRRAFLGGTGALVLSVALPMGRAQAQGTGPDVAAFLELRADGTALFRSPFVEGGQGIHSALAQIVGEELDLDPTRFTVETAPAGTVYQMMPGMRFTGGSFSVRSSYDTMRRLGAAARAMLLAAASERLGVPVAELTTDNGVVRTATGQSLSYGDLAEAAAALPAPADAPLRDKADFRWIGKPLARLDVHAKSTGQAQYSIDIKVKGMVYAAVQHAPRLGQEPEALTNEAEVLAMPGVASAHLLPGAVAVVANSWWRARRAVEALTVTWSAGGLPEDFSSAGHLAALQSATGDSLTAEAAGDIGTPTATRIEATYDAPYLAHAQLEPPSALARFNDDGTLDLWLPNQAPEMFQASAATVADLAPEAVRIHSPMLGGFFGRHFLYGAANPFPQAILLAKAVGKPVKVLWSREEEFLRDALRPISVARLSAGLDAEGAPVTLEALSIGEGPNERWYGRAPDQADGSAVEGLSGKVYAIPNRRIAQLPVKDPASIAYWRSVGHSKHDFFYESFLDEMADAGGRDPFALREALLADSPRHLNLLRAVADLAGGWQRGPFDAEGTKRARGVAMASPFGTEVATMAEVSITDGQVRVHDVWVAIDPGSVVNPAVVEAQVEGSVAIALSQTLVEACHYEAGQPVARNYDLYPILTPDMMPRVHVRIVESGAPMGGIGEPAVAGVPPAVVNAVSHLLGRRLRSLPLSQFTLS